MKLRMMKGLPGSGKSTLTKQFVKDSGNAGRINRDDLRAMIFDGVWTGPREKVIVEIEKAIAQVLAKNKMIPVIDDTNLFQSHEDMWKNFAKENNLEFEKDDVGTDLATCIERDKKRDKPIGEAIIQRMALDAGMIDFGEKKVIWVDVDGTTSNGSHREHFVTLNEQRTKKDWYGYFTEMVYDEPIQPIIDWVNELAKDYTICIVSGRPDTYQLETLYWLRHVAKIHFDYIFLRRGSDKRQDSETKNDILTKLPKENILLAIDDRPSIISLLRKNQIMVIPVRGECEDF
jgi:predicted kinase